MGSAKYTKPTKERMDQFCDMIREMDDWQSKILDETLARKWAVEAELVGMDEPLRGGALDAVNELRNEARRIFIMDHTIPDLNRRSMEQSLSDADFSRMDSDIKNALKYARGSKYGLRAPELKEDGLGIFVSDDLVPESLHCELVKELDKLAAKEPRDFHPGSYGKVQDLIDPSLYPYIAGVSPLASSDIVPPPFCQLDNKFHTEINRVETVELSSSYSWIPTVFAVSPDGTNVRIQSYINGLGTREQYPDLFRVLEKMFWLALPHFEKTLNVSRAYEHKDSDSVQRWEERLKFALDKKGDLSEEIYHAFLAKQAIQTREQKAEAERNRSRLREEICGECSHKEDFYQLGEEFTRSKRLGGKNLKVIIKASNYILKPGQSYDDGSWRMEGMPHERIISSMVYYYDTDITIEDRGLSFRKFRDEYGDFPTEIYGHDSFRVSFRRKKTSANGDENDIDEMGGDEEEYGEDNYPSDWEEETQPDGTKRPMSTSNLSEFISLGTVPTTNFDGLGKRGTGRIISFPNWIQHRAELVKNTLHPTARGAGEVARRKILCFFLLNDFNIQLSNDGTYINYPGFSITFPLAALRDVSDSTAPVPVLTTTDIPSQKLQCNRPTFRALLRVISQKLTGISIPVELVDIIWGYCSVGLMTRREAEEVRRKVMIDRKAGERDLNRWYSMFSLYQH